MFFSGMPVTVSRFYKTRIANTGVAREKEIYAVETPRDESICSDHSDEEHDELDQCLNDDTQQPVQREAEEELTEGVTVIMIVPWQLKDIRLNQHLEVLKFQISMKKKL